MSVLQPWVENLPMMQQTVLLTAIRGPDGIEKYAPIKHLLRWYRRCVLYSAIDHRIVDNPSWRGGGSFTGPSITEAEAADGWPQPMMIVVDRYMEDLDRMPMHFHNHLVHGCEIIGYKHPTLIIRGWWHDVYHRFVHSTHHYPESCEEMDKRLSDNRDNWLARNDRATIL